MSGVDFDSQMEMMAPEPQEPQAETGPVNEAQPTNPEEGQNSTDTEQQSDQNPEVQDNPEAEAKAEDKDDGKVKLPDTVKDYADLYSKKKWEGTPEQILAQVSKAYQELEPYAGNLNKHVSLMQQRATELEQAALSPSLDKINELRKANGYSPIQAQKSVEERTTEHQNLLKLINGALNNDQDAYNQLNDLLTNQSKSLEKESLLHEINGKAGDMTSEKARVEAHKVFNSLSDKHPDAAEKIDSIYQDKSLWPLFQSFGVSEIGLMRTPERAEAAYQLATLIHSAKNIEKTIEARVKEAIEKNANRSGASSVGGGVGNANSPRSNDLNKAYELQSEFM